MIRAFLCILLCGWISCTLSCYATEKQTICLNMIVKDEAAVIERCLTSVKPLIDYWLIVDTGSSDETQEIIRKVMKDIPGELHARPWVDFGFNRNEALKLAKAKADYILFMDADDQLLFSKEFQLPALRSDFYAIRTRLTGATHCLVPRMIKSDLDWEWIGVLHEYISTKTPTQGALLTDVEYLYNADGDRGQDPNRYMRDADLLIAALEKDPTNTRYAFYLAQAYVSAKKYDLALEAYQKRAAMQGGWDKEVSWSLYAIARLQEELGAKPEIIIASYCTAYQFDPTRAEPLCSLANYFYQNKQYLLSYLTSKKALTIPLPTDGMLVEEWMYDYGILFIYTLSARALGKEEEAEAAQKDLLLLKKPAPQP